MYCALNSLPTTASQHSAQKTTKKQQIAEPTLPLQCANVAFQIAYTLQIICDNVKGSWDTFTPN